MFSLSFTFQILPTAPKPRGMTGVTLRKWHPAPTVRSTPAPKPAASPAPWAAPAPASYCGGRAPAAPAANAQPAWMRDDPPATQQVHDPWQDAEDTKTTQVSVGALVKLMIGSGNMCRYEFGNCILTNILMYFVIWWHAIFQVKGALILGLMGRHQGHSMKGFLLQSVAGSVSFIFRDQTSLSWCGCGRGRRRIWMLIWLV